jgi:hypothetical protein
LLLIFIYEVCLIIKDVIKVVRNVEKGEGDASGKLRIDQALLVWNLMDRESHRGLPQKTTPREATFHRGRLIIAGPDWP